MLSILFIQYLFICRGFNVLPNILFIQYRKILSFRLLGYVIDLNDRAYTHTTGADSLIFTSIEIWENDKAHYIPGFDRSS